MQVATYEAAIRFMHSGAGNSAIQRVLGVAQRLSRCAMVAVLAVENDLVRIIASLDIPYSVSKAQSKTNPEIRDFFKKQIILDNIKPFQFKDGHPLLSEIADIKYVIATPVQLPLLPYKLILFCIDTINNEKRPIDIERWMKTVSDIFADELSLIGELAIFAEKDRVNLISSRDLSIDAVRSSETPAMIMDSELNIYCVSKALCAILGYEESTLLKLKPKDIVPTGYDFIVDYIDKVSADLNDNSNLSFHNIAGSRRYTLSTIKFSIRNSNSFFMLLSVHRVSMDMEREHQAEFPVYETEEISVTSEFLLRSVIKQRRLLHRSKAPYHATARWKKGVKDAQLAALRALKRKPPASFVDTIAREMAGAAESLFGRNTFGAVTNVPCGHSGEGCLAALLAKRIAELVGVPYRQAFATLNSTGSSHPTKNAKRPPMRIIDAIDCPVLLIDDVATSGSHIEEAARKLKKTAPAVLPLVWLAD